MKKIIVLDGHEIDEIKQSAESLCGCADNISYSCGDDETAEAIDRVETSILNHFLDEKVFEMDEVMQCWFFALCKSQIERSNEMIRQENLWALGSKSVEESQVHVENMMRLEKYKQFFQKFMEQVKE